MAPDAAFTALLVASSGAIACSLVIERLMTPRPRLLRPASAWALHIGLCASAHAVLTLLLGRPWFAGAALSAFLLLLVLVNNAKMKALREPFVFQDYEYFTDAIRHPRLYIPFLGWGKFIGAASGFVLAVLIGLLGEAIPDERFVWSGQLGAALVVLAGGILFVLVAQRKLPAASFVPENDVRALGLLSSLWLYRAAEQLRLQLAFPFQRLLPGEPVAELPHLVAVQSESFFDARALHPGIRRELLAELDRLQSEALVHGKLQVPAWGANTVRSEFAFLSGIAAEHLGVHRFNPYRAVAAGNAVPTLASHLQRLGYRTICIHPYPASFYRRDRAYPRLGFGEFLDLRTFDQAERDGPYVSDAALAEQVAAILRQASGPLFIFVITMENHGPLHLERVDPAEVEALYTQPPPPGCDDLTIYLRHLRNANRMIADVRRTLESGARPASLCWFGDHVPIMPAVYARCGLPSGEVDYVLWRTPPSRPPPRRVDLPAHDLATTWLRALGLAG